MSIDDFWVYGKYVEDEGVNHAPEENEEWLMRHCIRSEYEIQFAKCTGTQREVEDCCGPWRCE